MGDFRRLLAYLRPYRRLFALSCAGALLASLFEGLTFSLLLPFLRLLFGAPRAFSATPTALERGLEAFAGPWLQHATPGAALLVAALLILLAMLLKNVAYYASAYSGVVIQERIARDLRVDLFRHVERLGLAFFTRTRGGQLLARLVGDADQTRLAVSVALASVLRSGAVVLVYVAVLFALSWRLALVTLVLAPALALALRPLLGRIRRRARAAVEARGDFTATAHEAFAGARLVKAHAAEAYENERFTAAADGYVDAVLRTERLAILASPLSEVLGAGVVVLLLVIAAHGIGSPAAVRPEVFLVFLAVTLRLLSPVKALANFPALAAEALAAARRIFDVLELPTEDADDGGDGARAFPGVREAIVFSDVWAAYEPGQWVLRGIDLEVPKGSVVALVGPSGAGKSTLVDLLPRFLDPERGAVLVDGVPLTTFSRTALRRALGIVSQETVIFNDTVRRNIAYGDQADADPAAVEAAARAANAHDFIMRLPQGYDTRLGERGTRLSGGERQRIAIARVLLRDPPLLILDEATSALDPRSERLVQQAVARLLEHRTVFVIAHRLATVARADRIVVLDRGRIVEEGTHADLVQAGGLYSRLHRLELAGADA